MANTHTDEQTHPHILTIITLNIRGIQHKSRHLTTLIRRHKPDFVCLQETNINTQYKANRLQHKLGLKNTTNSLGTHSNGTCILQTSDRWQITKEHTHTHGRITAIEIEGNNTQYTLVNIYANSDRREQHQFYTELADMLTTQHNKHKIILTGDFNCTLDEHDIQNAPRTIITQRTDPRQKHLQTLNQIIAQHNLKDAYRTQNPLGTATTHTHKQTNSSARLDRYYIPTSNTHYETEHLNDTLNYTDHKAVKLTIGQNTNTQRPTNTTWKFNNRLLENTEYVKTITQLIQQYHNHLEEGQAKLTWELLKQTIKHTTKRIGKQIAKTLSDEINLITRAIHTARNDNTPTETIDRYEQHLGTLLQHKYRGAQIRSKYTQIQDETPNKHFLAIEQNVQRHRTVHEIKDIHGQTHTTNQEIANAFKDYYQTLFTDEATDENTQDEMIDYCTPLDEQDKDRLDTQITLNELKTSVQQLQPNKSPGPDGLTSEFYKHFFPHLAPLYFAMLKESFETGSLPDSLNNSITTLLPKDPTERNNLKKYRPISLLNTDYKILTKTLVNKLKPHMHKLIHTDQQCAVTKRNINNHTHFIRDLIQYTHDKHTRTALLSLDQEKAFDRVSHTFLHKTLERNNLGHTFTTWTKILYNKPTTQIIVNHTLSDPFPLTRSVRQGCSLSPLLYVLTLEPLLNKIRQNTNISTANIPNAPNKKLIAFADDTTFIINKEQDIQHILEDFKTFSRASGAKININKSEIMGLGQWKNRPNIHPRIKHTNTMKIYGIHYNNNPRKTHLDTWRKLEKAIEDTLNSYRYKTATIFGRSTIVNTYVIPQLLYQTSTHTPPTYTINKINSLETSYSNLTSNVLDTTHSYKPSTWEESTYKTYKLKSIPKDTPTYATSSTHPNSTPSQNTISQSHSDKESHTITTHHTS